jgi:hypothetical protein
MKLNATLSKPAMPHNGQIARLPLPIRQQPNQRLPSGEPVPPDRIEPN